MYITERDKYLLKHIEENGSLSLINASNLFFYGHKDNASRRLNQLVKAKKLKSYRTEYDFLTHQEKIFILPGMKKVKEHELLRENFKTLLELQFTDDEMIKKLKEDTSPKKEIKENKKEEPKPAPKKKNKGTKKKVQEHNLSMKDLYI